MKRRMLVILGWLGLLPPGQAGPNILWLVAEDLSADLGCYGEPLVATPHLDRLAGEGVRFTRAYATAPACSPCRTALVTGMYQTTLGAFHMRYPEELMPALPEGVKTLPQLFRAAGYRAANLKEMGGTGKNDWMFRADPKEHFDSSTWSDLKENQPFFAQLHFKNTHRKFAGDPERPIDQARVKLPPYYPDHPVARRDWADYLEDAQLLDDKVGAVLAKLEADGLAENTVVMFFSDHGRPFTRAKFLCYESGLRVPLIVRWPDRRDAGTVDERLVSLIDVSASTLAVGGVAVPPGVQGKVLFGADRAPDREYVFSARDRMGEAYLKQRSVRDRRYRYTRTYRDGISANGVATAYRQATHPIHHLLELLDAEGKLEPAQKALLVPIPRGQLFDLEEDPFELTNLAAKAGSAGVLERMSGVLDEWIEQSGDQGRKPDSNEIVEAFEEYGRASAASRKKAIARLRAEVKAGL